MSWELTLLGRRSRALDLGLEGQHGGTAHKLSLGAVEARVVGLNGLDREKQ